MNLLVIILVLLVIWRAYRGLKKGIAREITGLVSVFMALIILSISFLLIASIVEKNTKTIIVSVILLIVASFLCRLAGVVIKAVQTIAELPVINLFNSLLGLAAGILEVLAALWIMYVIIANFPTGRFGEQILTWTHQNTILVNIYNKNYIANWISGL